MEKPQFSIKAFVKNHTTLSIAIFIGFFLIITLIIAIIITSNSDNDGYEGTDSRAAEASILEDQKALKNTDAFGITNYLPIKSADPSYTISYELNKDDANNYSLKLALSAFSASARDTMIKRLLSENFGKYDPLDYEIFLENYYNPLTPYSLDDIKSGKLPDNFKKSNLYSFGDSNITVQTYIHTLYDGSTNTYRAILENGELKTKPQLLFTYADLPSVNKSIVKSLNSLE